MSLPLSAQMRESLHNAEEELKRADHLVFVSLKYTRTVDIIKNIIERLANAYYSCMEALLLMAKEKGKLKDIPVPPIARAELVKEIYADDHTLRTYMELYVILRKLRKAKFIRLREHRRHVTMVATLDEEDVEVDIDIITEYFHKTAQLVEYIRSLAGEAKE